MVKNKHFYTFQAAEQSYEVMLETDLGQMLTSFKIGIERYLDLFGFIYKDLMNFLVSGVKKDLKLLIHLLEESKKMIIDCTLVQQLKLLRLPTRAWII